MLLILAGVSINTLFGETGIIKSAQSTKEKMEIEVLRERIEVIKVNWEADRIMKDSITIRRLWQDLKEADIIEDIDRDVRKEKESTENGETKTEYEIDTKDGYQVSIIVITDENGKIEIKIEEIINNESALPKVTVKLSNPTTNGVTVTADVRRAEGKLIYLYKLEEETEYTKYIETEETEITITGLKENKTYEIKVEASNKNGIGYGNGTVITKKLETPTVELLEKTWNNGKATIKISSTSSFPLQYQIDAIEENGWQNYSEVAITGITGLEHGQTVYTRIYDGTNGSLGKDFAIQDLEEPASATITATTSYNITSGTTTNIKATVTHIDNESGINITSCKYVFNSSETELGTDESLYTEGTFSSNGQEISKNVSKGTYYLHVLTVDNAGNKKETVKGPITVVQKVTGISLNKTSAEIKEDETLQLTATVIPNTAENQGVNWSSSNTSIATVNSNGLVTAIGKGETTITVTAKDGSGKTASCIVIVKELTVVDSDLKSEDRTINSETVIAKDIKGNQVVVPGGFKISADSGTSVQQGIVIEDAEGNQFVWVPVSNIDGSTTNPIILDDGTEKVITLGRYTFGTSSPGTPGRVQKGSEYENTVSLSSGGCIYQELPTYRESNGSSGTNGTNTTAKNLKAFIENTKDNKGYYIARYEASYGSGNNTSNWKPLSKPSTSNSTSRMYYNKGTLWNFITQPQAAKVSQNMYSGNSYVESDLINSYAWDTAIVYIQAMGNTNYANKRDGNGTLKNTGSTQDEVCKIFDMGGNMIEWTTEYCTDKDKSSAYPCSFSGSNYDSANNYTSYRSSNTAVYVYNGFSFRPILYVK